MAYLVNVHVRPGYNFPNAEAAIGYGQSICDHQAVNELCPAQIWQLRQSAGGYTVPAQRQQRRPCRDAAACRTVDT